MRSKAHFKGHPLHPAVIPFPFAFLLGAVGFDIAGRFTGSLKLWTTGGYLAWAGIVAALVAAVPGFMDYLYSVPPNSTGKRRATQHMILNLSAVLLFIVASILRGVPAVPPERVLLALELIGAGLLLRAGWLGGVLVSRNQISVDHRYADAGKWREARVDAHAGEAVMVARADELKPNQMKLLRTPSGRIALARTETGWFAFEDRCTHRGGSLADGTLACGTVQCPWHGSQFDVATGATRAGPAKSPVRTYAIEERDGALYLTL